MEGDSDPAALEHEATEHTAAEHTYPTRERKLTPVGSSQIQLKSSLIYDPKGQLDLWPWPWPRVWTQKVTGS